MNEEWSSEYDAGLEACHKNERNGKKGEQVPGCTPEPHWPTGLLLPPRKDVTCFIPVDLAVIVAVQPSSAIWHRSLPVHEIPVPEC